MLITKKRLKSPQNHLKLNFHIFHPILKTQKQKNLAKALFQTLNLPKKLYINSIVVVNTSKKNILKHDVCHFLK